MAGGDFRAIFFTGVSLLVGGLLPGRAAVPVAPTRPPNVAAALPTRPTSGPTETGSVLLGIDVLEASRFRAIAGKRIGLLTHAAGVNRRGERTIDVLRRAPNARLVALFAPEHGLTGKVEANVDFEDSTDARTGLPVYSLHGHNRKPTAAQLKGLDALVIDLQDIGVRSYTYSVVTRYAMEACFAQGVEVIICDRPNPLGGEKVDGPLLDRPLMSGVGAYEIPYVHGLTLGELARFAAGTPGALAVPESVRRRGQLTVVPMRGWRRAMRWPDTGLTFVPTSPAIPDFATVMGYAMTGLGCEYSGFEHGFGTAYPFRALTFKGVPADRLRRDLSALNLPGLAFRRVATTDAHGVRQSSVYVEVVDWRVWRPTELSFYLHQLACRYDPPNPFLRLDAAQARKFNIHVGSSAWWAALRREGARVNVARYVNAWLAQDQSFRRRTRRFWLYH